MGVNIVCNTEIKDIEMLKNAGYTAVILAVGASDPGVLRLEKGDSSMRLTSWLILKQTTEIWISEKML